MNNSEHVLELTSPYEVLDCNEAFENLTEKERKYLHFYSKVSKHFATALKTCVILHIILCLRPAGMDLLYRLFKHRRNHRCCSHCSTE